ncbi:MAG: hypothetical protein FRX48_05651 [Lasallia pustulata]|uniref:Uncharacterized protein n=1 Tax=Lasallia pustulata TaxID=136370 RepID=A0A5M8PMS0_9LECA|nr:MAG: hypothetical protein FRX48_05651 [Lasallia pustulata]
MCEVNGRFLLNCLSALSIASIIPKRFPIAVPHQEDDPGVTIEPNSYYPREDILWDWGKKNSMQWNVICLSFILGAVRHATVNIVYPLCVYAAVQAHMKQSLVFPGDYLAWDKEQIQSSAMLNSYMSEWTASTPAASDEAFNAGDDFPFYWSCFWPVLAS